MTHSTYQSVRHIVALLKHTNRKKVYSEKDVRFAIQICAGANPQTVKNYEALLKEVGITKPHNGAFVIDEDAFMRYCSPFMKQREFEKLTG